MGRIINTLIAVKACGCVIEVLRPSLASVSDENWQATFGVVAEWESKGYSVEKVTWNVAQTQLVEECHHGEIDLDLLQEYHCCEDFSCMMDDYLGDPEYFAINPHYQHSSCEAPNDAFSVEREHLNNIIAQKDSEIARILEIQQENKSRREAIENKFQEIRQAGVKYRADYPDDDYCPRVYLMESNGFYKIGITTKLKSRWTQLNRSVPVPVRIVHYFASKEYRAAESLLHRRYTKRNVEYEWFALTPDQVEEIRSIPDYGLDPLIEI